MADAEASERLDRVLTARLDGYSRAAIQRWIVEGGVTVDGASAQPKQKLRAAQVIVVRPGAPPTSHAAPQDLPLTVLYEDAHLIVVDKAAGMVVHPAPGHPDGTLVNAVLHRFGWLPGEDATRPGIVHRLDAHTSGVMVVARSELAKRELVERFASHDIERAYLAIVRGAFRTAVTYDTLHGRHPRDRKKFSSHVARGKQAITHVKPLEMLEGATLVRCTLETGRTHQIRVHLSDARFPILGDPLYARLPKDPTLRAAAQALGRQALHAAVLGFAHPDRAARRLRVGPRAPARELRSAERSARQRLNPALP